MGIPEYTAALMIDLLPSSLQQLSCWAVSISILRYLCILTPAIMRNALLSL